MSFKDGKKAYLSATPMQRETVRRLLCGVLGCLRAQYLSYQTSHWQVRGGAFYSNHLLFQRLYGSVQEQVDQLAEKISGYLGSEAVSLNYQMRHIADFTYRWSQISCNHKRGLQSEADLQYALKRAYDGIKQAQAMTLGLDDWIMATANAHEENEYLLQQALAPIPKEAGMGNFEVEVMLKGKKGVETKIVKIRAKDEDEAKARVRQKYRGKLHDIGFTRKGSGAPSAEGAFYDNPEKKEVLEFAQSGAISNSVEISEAASQEDHLDVSEQEAVAEAEEAPPTPAEIAREPGGDAVSTLNRFVVETQDPSVAPAVQMNEEEGRVGRLAKFSEWNMLPGGGL